MLAPRDVPAMIGAMPRWLAWTLAGACAVPTVVVLRAGGDVALAGASPWAQALVVGAGLAVVAAAAAAQDDRSVRRGMLAAGAAAWLAAEWANPAAPGAALFTAGWIATGLALPLVLGATLAGAGAVRALAAGALVLAAGGAVLQGPARAFAADPRAAGCPDCPADLLAIASQAGARRAAWAPRCLARSGACAAAFCALALGVLRSSPAARRRLSAIAAPTSAFAAASGAELWLTLRGGLAAPGVRTAHLLVAVALIALALSTRVRPLLLRRARRTSRPPRPRSGTRTATRWPPRSPRSSAMDRWSSRTPCRGSAGSTPPAIRSNSPPRDPGARRR